MNRLFSPASSPEPVRCLFLAALALVSLPRLGFGGAEPGEATAGGSKDDGVVSIRIEDERAVIENPLLALEISTASKRLRTASIENRITGASTALLGEDFVLVFAGGPTVRAGELVLERSLEEGAGEGARRLAFDLARDDLRVRLVIEMRPAEWWATRWLEIQGGKGVIEKMSLSEWRVLGTWGPPGPGKTIVGLGASQGLGQAAYVDDLFFAIEHPGAESFARGKRIACRISALDALGPGTTVTSRRFVVGVGDTGSAVQAFLQFIRRRRANPPRMAFLLGDDAWKGSIPDSKVLGVFGEVKSTAGLPIDSVLLGEGWEGRDGSGPPWSSLDPGRFPGGWKAIEEAARAAGLGVSFRFGAAGAELFCLAGSGSPKGLVETLTAWASRGIFALEIDGLSPDCSVEGHGHPVGAGGAVVQMDALAKAASLWRKARPGLLVAHLRGSNPSPFWLEHVDFVSPGGAEGGDLASAAQPEGQGGEPLDRNATSIDCRLHVHRPTEMPISAFAVVDLVGAHAAASSDAAFERNAWWLVARTSLRHEWRVKPEDLTPERWKALAAAARWGKARERSFGSSRMVGGDPGEGAIYGFAALEGPAGVLSLRNPSSEPASLARPLYSLLAVPRSAAKGRYRLAGVYGETKVLEGTHEGRARLAVELPPLAVAIFEVTEERADEGR